LLPPNTLRRAIASLPTWTTCTKRSVPTWPA
jgi:hypothetical protein